MRAWFFNMTPIGVLCAAGMLLAALAAIAAFLGTGFARFALGAGILTESVPLWWLPLETGGSLIDDLPSSAVGILGTVLGLAVATAAWSWLPRWLVIAYERLTCPGRYSHLRCRWADRFEEESEGHPVLSYHPWFVPFGKLFDDK